MCTVNFFYPPGEHDGHYFIHWAKESCNCETDKCCSDGRVLCCSQDHCTDQCSHCSSVWQSGCDVPAVSAEHSHSCRDKFSGTIHCTAVTYHATLYFLICSVWITVSHKPWCKSKVRFLHLHSWHFADDLIQSDLRKCF